MLYDSTYMRSSSKWWLPRAGEPGDWFDGYRVSGQVLEWVVVTAVGQCECTEVHRTIHFKWPKWKFLYYVYFTTIYFKNRFFFK